MSEFHYLQRTKYLKPILIVEYDRVSFDVDYGIRITIDKNVRTSFQVNRFLCENLDFIQVGKSNQNILELKFSSVLPAHIVDILNLKKYTRTAFSKYYYSRLLDNFKYRRLYEF